MRALAKGKVKHADEQTKTNLDLGFVQAICTSYASDDRVLIAVIDCNWRHEDSEPALWTGVTLISNYDSFHIIIITT